MSISGLRIQKLTSAQIHTFINWRYPQPYALYNIETQDLQATVAFFSNPANGYFAIVDSAQTLLGFCTFGADAQVPGGDYRLQALDIGMGIRPDLTGQGHGVDFAWQVLAFASRHYPQRTQRVTIAEFNRRAQKVYQRLGFEPAARFHRAGDGRPFITMLRVIPAEEERG